MPVTINAVVAGIELSNNTLLQSGVVIIEILLGNIFGVTNIFNIFFSGSQVQQWVAKANPLRKYRKSDCWIETPS